MTIRPWTASSNRYPMGEEKIRVHTHSNTNRPLLETGKAIALAALHLQNMLSRLDGLK